MDRTNFNPETVRAPFSSYSNGALVVGGDRMLHTAGQVGIAPDGSIAQGIEAQIEQVYANLAAVLAAAEMSFADVVKLNCFLTDIAQLTAHRAALKRHMGDVLPANTTIVVKSLASLDFLVEIDVVAIQ